MGMKIIQADKELIKNATEIFNTLGIDLETGIEVYLRQVVDKKGIPFEVSLEITESDGGLEDLKQHRTESFDSLDDLIDEVNSEE